MEKEWPKQQRGAQVVAADAPDEGRCDACSKVSGVCGLLFFG